MQAKNGIPADQLPVDAMAEEPGQQPQRMLVEVAECLAGRSLSATRVTLPGQPSSTPAPRSGRS